MKLEDRARIICIISIVVLEIITVINMFDYITISKTVGAVFLLAAIPALLLICNGKSRFSRVVINLALIIIAVFGCIYAIYLRRPLGFLLLISVIIALVCRIIYPPTSRKDKLHTKILITIILCLSVLNLIFLANQLFRTENYITANGSASMWNSQLQEFADSLCKNAETDEQKVEIIYNWVKDNIDYDYDKEPAYQYFTVQDTMVSHKGLCFDYACLFNALCRSQGIPCITLDGYDRQDAYSKHTWNRVYYNGSWYNLDVTFDTQQKTKVLYGFCPIDYYDSQDEDYVITRIY